MIPNGAPNPPGSYTPGYSENAVRFMSARRAERHAAFFLPRLRPGMRVLDCGCGPGTITRGLAERVAQGEVVGIDVSEGQVALARAGAAEARAGHPRFEVAGATALPFEDASFDGIFSHALLEHQPRPEGAVAEMRRVLWPGGFVGVASPDWGGFLLAPFGPGVDEALRRDAALQRANGGDLFVGRRLGELLLAAGFADVEMGATYECYEDRGRIAEYLALRLEAEPEQDTGLARSAKCLRDWGRRLGGLFAQA
jgi:SAM-dependent methyltransferase